MNSNTIVLLGVGYLVTKALRTAKNAARISYDIVGIQVHNVRVLKNEIEIKIRYLISNPSPTTITVDEIAANIYSNGQFIGFANMSEPKEISGKSQVEIRLTTKLPITRVIGVIINFLTTKKLGQVTIDGTITAMGKNFPLTKTLNAS